MGKVGRADGERLPAGVGVDRAGVDERTASPVLIKSPVALHRDARVDLQRLSITGIQSENTPCIVDCGSTGRRYVVHSSGCFIGELTVHIPSGVIPVDGDAIGQGQAMNDVKLAVHGQVATNRDRIELSVLTDVGRIKHRAIVADQGAAGDDAGEQVKPALEQTRTANVQHIARVIELARPG